MRICICVATFNRPKGLNRLLKSLTELKFPRNPIVKLSIAIADNDQNGSALEIVKAAERCNGEHVKILDNLLR